MQFFFAQLPKGSCLLAVHDGIIIFFSFHLEEGSHVRVCLFIRILIMVLLFCSFFFFLV